MLPKESAWSWLSSDGSKYEGTRLTLATACNFWLKGKQQTSTGLKKKVFPTDQ